MFQNKLLASTCLGTESYQKQLRNHRNFLKKFQTFPQKTRKATYKQILMLPNNYNHLQQLTKPYTILPQHGLNKQVAIVTDILGRLYPQLKNQWIPSMIHPFVKLFQQDFSFSFECSLTFLVNWMKPILFEFPNANKQITQVFQDCLPSLKQKIQSLNYPISSLINPIFVVTLTDILNKKDWLQICDFWVTNPFQPQLLITVVLAIVQFVQESLQKLFSVQQMSLSLRRQKNISIQKIMKRSKQLSQKYRQKFQIIYKDKLFPIQKGRYPVQKFFKDQIRKINSKLQAQNDVQVQHIKNKYQKVQSMLQMFIHEGHLSDEKAIEQKYQMVEGQIQQYLNIIKRQHANKMQAMRQVQSKFNSQIQLQGQNRQSNMNAIQKRARLQREIDMILSQSESIKMMQDQMMKRIRQCAKIKKNQFRKSKQRLNNR